MNPNQPMKLRKLKKNVILKLAVAVWLLSILLFAVPFAFALEGVAEEATEHPAQVEPFNAVVECSHAINGAQLCHFEPGHFEPGHFEPGHFEPGHFEERGQTDR